MTPWTVTRDGEVRVRATRRLLGSARPCRIPSTTWNGQLAMRTTWIAKLHGGLEIGDFNKQRRAAEAVYKTAEAWM